MIKSRIAFAMLASFAGAAHAEPGGTSGISSPSVTQGALKLEWRSAYSDGGALDGAWSHRAQIGYGVTDHWRAQLNLRAADPAGDNAELRSIGIENAVEFPFTNAWPVQFGGQVEYKFGIDDVEDSIELKLLAERRAGNFYARFNITAERDATGDSDEWEHVYSARLNWTLDDIWQVGVEGFSEPEADAHYFGPRAGVSIGETVLSLGYLAGLDDARADALIRLSLEWSPR